jgi:hypothetical protein
LLTASAERISDERQEVDELKQAREATAPQLAAMRAEAPCPIMPWMSKRCSVPMAALPGDQRKDVEAVSAVCQGRVGDDKLSLPT